MRIVHLSTHDERGGAARAAWRLHQGLREVGVDSRMVVRTKHGEDTRISATDDGTLGAWHEQIATPWLQKRLTAGSSWFTVGCFNAFVENHPWVREAEVLHLHWVAEWLSAEAVARLAATGKPLFWTLHDLWPVTGGNHYAGTNSPEGQAWQTGEAMPESLRDIAAREFDRKFRAIRDLPLRVISPSRWLADVVRRSRIGSGWRIDVRPYGIDTGAFRTGERSAARTRWGLPPEKILLLFGCQSLDERRKGFPELREALQLAAQDPAFGALVRESKVELAIFGSNRPALDDLPLPARHLGVVAEAGELASVYQAADAFLCPALEDNLPTTVIESLACGLPVLGFTTGGVPELIRDGENGLLAPCGDVPALAACIVRFVTDAELRRGLQAVARELDSSWFSMQTEANRALESYQAALAREDSISAATISPEPASPTMTCTVIPSESAWLLRAAADSVSLAAEREAALRRKLEESKARLARLKTKAPPSPKPAERQVRWYQRWRRQ